VRELPGIDLNEDGQLVLLEALKQYYPAQPFTSQPQLDRRYRFDNPAFGHCDAIILYCLMRHARPRRIVEVGSGYSSCVFLDTNDLNFGGGIACTFIDPYPELLRSLLRPGDAERVRILQQEVQDIDTAIVQELEAGDMLFIDSSHIAKTGSDTNYEVFELLPRVRAGVYIHFHDVFYPFEYPRNWVYQGRAWNEAYLLRAFLQYNEQFRIVLFNSFLEQFHREKLAREMPLCLQYREQDGIRTTAQSIWLQRV
jgi:predicted O-methyltransferase YrrM